MNLKKALIRLAYEKPEFRKYLLPLVKEATADRRLLQEAEELGRKAYEAGQPASPAQDRAMMQFIQQHSTGMGWSTPFLKAWSKGWNQANASADW